MVLSEIFRGNNEVREAARAGVQIDTVSVASASDAASAADGSGKITGAIRPSAVAGSFYPADRTALKQLINQQLDYGRKLLQQLEPTLPAGVPRAVIVPHAGYIYSGTAAALAYALGAWAGERDSRGNRRADSPRGRARRRLFHGSGV